MSVSFPDLISTWKAIAAFSLSFLTVIVNASVIVVIWKDSYKQLKGTANYLILNLALCDLLVVLLGELLFGLSHWLPYENVTGAAYIFTYLAFCASFLTILGLAVERLIVISPASNSTDYLTISYLSKGSFAIWILATLLAFLPVTGWPDSFDGYRVFIGDAIPFPILVLLLACYSRIYFIVRKTLFLFNNTRGETRRGTSSNRKCSPDGKAEKEREKCCLLRFHPCWNICRLLDSNHRNGERKLNLQKLPLQDRSETLRGLSNFASPVKPDRLFAAHC